MVATPASPPSRPLTHTAPDGIVLTGERWAGHRQPTLVFSHGFGQTRHAWSGAARTLAGQGYGVVTFDARGHGESEHVPRGEYHMEQFVADLLSVSDLATEGNGPRPVAIGASMGGLLALVAAGEYAASSPFSALVLVDITPRWETRGIERILGFMRAHPEGFADYDEAASAIEAYLPHRTERKTEHQLKPLLRHGHDGRLRWHWDPALLDGLVSESERYQPRLLEAAAKVQVPVLLLSGARSDVVSRQNVEEFMGLVPHAKHVSLDGATHMVAGDANDAFTREIARFLETPEQDVPSSN